MRNICDVIIPDKKYYIYGTALFAQYCYAKITQNFGDDSILGFIETVPQKDKFCEKNVISVNEADNTAGVIISGFKSVEAMKNNLIKSGFCKETIYEFPEYKNYFILNNNRIMQACYWPPIKKYNKDLVDKISWFLPDRIAVKVWTDDIETIDSFNENVEVCNIEDIDKIMKKSDCICIWDTENAGDIPLKYADKVKIVDPNFFHAIDVYNYGLIYYSSFAEKEKEIIHNHSINVFKQLKKKSEKCEKANIICSGPSIEELDFKQCCNDFNIICNSMIKDRQMLEELKPDLIVFSDTALFFSPNEYCRRFYNDLIYACRHYNIYIVTLSYRVPLLKKHFPELSEYLIGVRGAEKGEYKYFDENALYIKGSDNVCTAFMLPIASALFDVIQISGCTGRAPNDVYFWKYKGNFQYEDLMPSVFESYPSFKRDINHDDYYDVHCACMKDIIEYGEKLGKEYINLTTSFIPALKERTKKDV